MDEFLDFMKLALYSVLIIVILLLPIFGIVAITQKNYCNTMTSLHGDFEFHYDFWAGCLVKTPSGYWIDASKYQYLEGDVR